ncbi:MAG: EAL domain-containing protein [Desulfuromonadales bacterium]|nr:EAL domain-containing protein [Desulfuromonadales bacterium]
MSNPSGNLSNAPLILVVDDDMTSRLLMRSSLEKAGFRVREAADGLVALSLFEEIAPAAVLLDVMMPKLDGFDTCRAIRKLPGGDNTPILMVTGMEDIGAIHSSFEVGATDFISKPINWTILNYRVKYMLRASEAFLDVIDKQQQIQELAFFDHLTGLANRTLFTDSLEISLAESADEESQLAVLFLDLDRFKAVNDTLGHHVGDMLLKGVADRISQGIRETDLFSRLKKRQSKSFISRVGGDEFMIMLPRLKEPEDAGRVASRIKETLAAPFFIDDHEIYITASTGISVFPLDGTDSETLIKHADIAMYHAKEKGKNGFQFYKKSLNIKAGERLQFENDVRKAVANNDFMLYYQPQVDLKTGKIVGAEALSRWQHDTHGPVSPGEFIPVIEELGLVPPFTEWVIGEVGAQRSRWQAQGFTEQRVAVNISSKHFAQQKLPENFAKALGTHNLDAIMLELELTESVLAQTDSETLAILKELKALNLTISVDDFGTGYFSLVYLKTFPVDIVKIDRFFIKDILTSEQDASIVRAIIALAHSMDIKVVAEGIEEKAQYELLCEMGCDYGQGFLFSPAVPEESYAQMLVNGISLV